jgi:hypothetical protein
MPVGPLSMAWIQPSSTIGYVDSAPQKVGDKIRVFLTYTNIGKEPALAIMENHRLVPIVWNGSSANSTNLRIGINNTCRSATTKYGIGVAWPNIPATIVPDDFTLVTQQILDAKTIIILQGCYSYATFEKRHESAYCYILDRVPSKPIAEWFWFNCPDFKQNFAN